MLGQTFTLRGRLRTKRVEMPLGFRPVRGQKPPGGNLLNKTCESSMGRASLQLTEPGGRKPGQALICFPLYTLQDQGTQEKLPRQAAKALPSRQENPNPTLQTPPSKQSRSFQGRETAEAEAPTIRRLQRQKRPVGGTPGVKKPQRRKHPEGRRRAASLWTPRRHRR